MTRVLFVCVKNGGKSQLAAALLNRLSQPDDGIEVASAGTRAGARLNAESVESLAELGLDISDQHPRQLTPELVQASDLVITVGGDAEVEPLPGPAYERWEVDEPSLRGIGGQERMRLVRDDIDRQVHALHRRLTTS